MRERTGTYCSSVQEELVKLKEDTPSLFGVGLLVQVCVKVAQQCCWVKLGHHMMQKNSQVSWARFQELNVLETAALSINLLLFSVKVVVLCSNDLRPPSG